MRHPLTNRRLACIFLAAVGLALAPAANAVLMMSLTDTGTGDTVSLVDTDGNGILFYAGSVGDWDLNITTGLGSPILGSHNRLDLNTITVTGGVPGGNLTMMLTDTGFSEGSYSNYYAAAGGTTDGNVSFQAYLDNANQAWGTSTLLHDSGWIGGNPYSSGHGGGVSTSGLFSMTLVATLSHSTAFSVTSFDYLVTVPEPVSLLLIGIGLLTLGFSTRRRRCV